MHDATSCCLNHMIFEFVFVAFSVIVVGEVACLQLPALCYYALRTGLLQFWMDQLD